jgi:hypothetical protein
VTGEHKEALLQHLWPAGARPNGGVWGILDCARDPAIYGALVESRLEFRCLFSGALPREVEMNAPQLVELLPSNRLIHRWLDAGWGQSWGVMLRIGDAANLRHHLRKMLKVRAEGYERPLLFRFYDPRVLRAVLPTCSAEQLREVFGPVQSYLAEQADGTLNEYRFDGNAIRQQSLEVGVPN